MPETLSNYDFETCIDRRDTGSLKWEKYAGRDVLPLWVADMDFVCAPEILDALQERLNHGVLGYTIATRDAEDAALAYLKRAHGYEARREWLVWMHGMVPGLNVAARAFGSAGDAVLTCTPVYPPFLSAPAWQDRECQTSPLIYQDGRWTFDFEDLARKVTPKTRCFFLCSPHNPVGRVFDEDEIRRIATFCLERDIVLLSDEIHCDLLLDEVKHTCTATLSPEIEDNTITFMAPSKTWNVPGLACAFAVIKNPTIRQQFRQAARGFVTEVNAFGYAGLTAAYNHGEPWRQALLQRLRANRDLVYRTLGEHLPEIKLLPMQATYLAWLNIEGLQKLGIDDAHSFFIQTGVGLSPGRDFGDARWLRLNFGCPQATLEEALRRMCQAVAERRSTSN